MEGDITSEEWIKKMSKPGLSWDLDEDYAYLKDASRLQYAWEFIRRNPAYQQEWRAAHKENVSGSVHIPYMEHYGIINEKAGKWMLGAFFPPACNQIDLSFLHPFYQYHSDKNTVTKLKCLHDLFRNYDDLLSVISKLSKSIKHGIMENYFGNRTASVQKMRFERLVKELKEQVEQEFMKIEEPFNPAWMEFSVDLSRPLNKQFDSIKQQAEERAKEQFGKNEREPREMPLALYAEYLRVLDAVSARNGGDNPINSEIVEVVYPPASGMAEGCASKVRKQVLAATSVVEHDYENLVFQHYMSEFTKGKKSEE
jgi:hypothetical protein